MGFWGRLGSMDKKACWATLYFFFFFWPRLAACGILVPGPGIEPAPPAVEAWRPNHWTAREVPTLYFNFPPWKLGCSPLERLTSVNAKVRVSEYASGPPGSRAKVLSFCWVCAFYVWSSPHWAAPLQVVSPSQVVACTPVFPPSVSCPGDFIPQQIRMPGLKQVTVEWWLLPTLLPCIPPFF